MESAFEFIKKNGGITTENNYPYKAKDERCDMLKAGPFNTTKKNKNIIGMQVTYSLYCVFCVSQMNAPVVTIDGHESVPVNDERALMKAVAHQPVSVAIDAGGSDLQFYSEVCLRLNEQHTLVLRKHVREKQKKKCSISEVFASYLVKLI